MTAAKTDTVRTAYLEGRSIAALARAHGVSRGRDPHRLSPASCPTTPSSRRTSPPRSCLPTPYDVHFGLAEQLREMRADVLQAAYAKHPERFICKPPEPPKLPATAWINKPPPDGPLIPAQR